MLIEEGNVHVQDFTGHKLLLCMPLQSKISSSESSSTRNMSTTSGNEAPVTKLIPCTLSGSGDILTTDNSAISWRATICRSTRGSRAIGDTEMITTCKRIELNSSGLMVINYKIKTLYHGVSATA